MELTTISQVSKMFGISTRTLRYYEEIGLIQSERINDYAYRVYSEKTIVRLKQIVILRKLRIPLAQVAAILDNNDAQLALSVFQESIDTIDEEVTALTTIKSILHSLIKKLNDCLHADIKYHIFGDQGLTTIVDTLQIAKIKFKNEKEEKLTSDFNKIGNVFTGSKVTTEIVRIEFLLPMRVLSSYTKESGGIVSNLDETRAKFDEAVKSLPKYPRCEHFEFISPYHPDKMVEIYPIPKSYINNTIFVDYEFQGGLFATLVANCDNIGEVWKALIDWVDKSDLFEVDTLSRNGTREEIFGIPLTPEGGSFNKCGLASSPQRIEIPDIKTYAKIFQWDLLLPIKMKESTVI